MKICKTVFLLISAIFFFSNCNDDENITILPEITACTEDAGIPVINFDTSIVYPCPLGFNIVQKNRYQYAEPVFNPNNENEIIYIRREYEESSILKREIWKYNFCTENATFITDLVSHDLDWSRKDWVIFTAEDRQLYKIKSNGDSLTRLTLNGDFNNQAKWNDAGTKYLYERLTSPLSGLRVCDEFGNVQDTLDGLTVAHSWTWDNEDNRIFYSEIPEDVIYGEYYSETDELEPINTLSLAGSADRIITKLVYRKSDNRLYFASSLNLAYHDLATDEVVHLTQGADNRAYGPFDIPKEGNTIIVSRIDLEKTDVCTVEIEVNLYLIDVTGEREREVVLPE